MIDTNTFQNIAISIVINNMDYLRFANDTLSYFVDKYKDTYEFLFSISFFNGTYPIPITSKNIFIDTKLKIIASLTEAVFRLFGSKIHTWGNKIPKASRQDVDGNWVDICKVDEKMTNELSKKLIEALKINVATSENDNND